MKCSQSYKYFQSGFNDSELSEHLKSCEACSELFGRINQTLAILDEKVEIPSGKQENDDCKTDSNTVITKPFEPISGKEGNE